MVVASTEKLPALVKPLEMLKGRVRTVIVWGAGDADAAAVCPLCCLYFRRRAWCSPRVMEGSGA